MKSLRALLVSLTVHGLLGVATAHAQVVLNEVDYDQPGADTAEFIELRNSGTSSVNLGTFQIQLVNGANGGAVQYSLISLPAFDLPAGEYFVVCANAATVAGCDLDVTPNTDQIQNGSPDAIALLDGGVIVDALSYEGNVPGFTERTGVTLAAADAGVAEGLSRCPDGADTGDNSVDFSLRAISPGGANNCPVVGGGVGACGDPATLISAVQGSGATTPLAGSTVVVEGTVVGDFQPAGALNGFFVQEEDVDADADPATSEGLFIFTGGVSVDVQEGDRVRVRGTAGEFSSQTQLSSVTDLLICMDPGVASVQAVQLPVANLADLERFEGMRAQIPGPLTVTGNFELGRFGSLDVAVGGRLFNPTQLATPGMAANLLQDLNSRSRIVLDDGSNTQNPNPIPYKDLNNTRRVGDTLASLAGVLSGSFGVYRIHPTRTPPLFQAGNPRPAAPEAVMGRVRVATANVLNYFTTLDTGMPSCGPSGGLDCRGANTPAELERQRTKILNELVGLAPDIAALIEIENNASTAAADLVAGLNDRLGAGTFTFVDTGTIGTDAIKLALLYRPAVVRPVGPFAILNSAVDPRFIDTKNRPSLAQTFEDVATGARFTVIDNHLKSKGSACTDVGDPDLGDGQGNCSGTRNAAAAALLDWIASDPTGSGDPDFLVLGDFNAYAMEDPIRTLVAGGLVPLVDQRIGTGAYSFQFQGQSGYLDHAFATPSLAAQITGITEWHINADEPVVLDYNQEFKTDDPYSGADPFKASDHDPLLVGIAPTLPAPVVPQCLGFPASVYVSAGRIVGGPDAGRLYTGLLRGSGKADILVGTSGNDELTGRGGADLVCGGGGDDVLVGSDGADLLFGEAGNDELLGKAGRDSLAGGPGIDVCRGGDGMDRQDGSCETALNIP